MLYFSISIEKKSSYSIYSVLVVLGKIVYGLCDLKHDIDITPNSVECPVVGCTNKVDRQRHSFRREERFLCPEHKIYISPSTFDYDQETDNLLWNSEEDLVLLETIKKVKRECRISRDNSEDAVTWNVFRYLKNTNQLDNLLTWIAQSDQHNTDLIYWSYSQEAQGAWSELNKARKEFGENLQRSSEPDLIALTDKGLFFIEAKLTATNNTTPSNRNIRNNYLTGGNEWIKQVFTSKYETIAIDSKLFELFRFWLLGTWLASQMAKDFYLINIVLTEREKDIEQRLFPHICQSGIRQFKKITWEDICKFIHENAPENNNKEVILNYFENKTIGYYRSNIQRAFILA